VQAAHGAPVLGIIGMADLIEYLRETGNGPPGVLERMQDYRDRYGV
jgi:hypothetical protein